MFTNPWRPLWLAIACAAACGAAAVARAGEPHAHVHGIAQMQISVEGNRLDLLLETPLDNVLGFEHAPGTEAQRAAVKAMAARLRRTEGLLVPSPAAKCRLSKVTLASAALPPDLLGEGPHAAQPTPDPDGHADLDASYTWICDAPERLDGLEVGLIAAFGHMRQLNVQVVSPRGQSATQLSGNKRRVGW